MHRKILFYFLLTLTLLLSPSSLWSASGTHVGETASPPLPFTLSATLWKSFSQSRIFFATSIIRTREGGYALAGRSHNPSNQVHDVVYKLGADASLNWNQNKYVGLWTDDLPPGLRLLIQQTGDGGYFLLSSVISVLTVETKGRKLSGAGQEMWERKCIQGVTAWPCYFVLASNDSPTVATIAGFDDPHDVGVLQSDQNCDLEWVLDDVIPIGIAQIPDDRIYETPIFEAEDNRFIVASNMGSQGVGVAKVTSSGKKLWSQTISTDLALGWAVPSDDGQILLGGTDRAETGLALHKLNANGSTVWHQFFPTKQTIINQTFGIPKHASIAPTSDGGVLMVYLTKHRFSSGQIMGLKDVFELRKFNDDGEEVWKKAVDLDDLQANEFTRTWVFEHAPGTYIVAINLKNRSNQHNGVWMWKLSRKLFTPG